MTKQISLNETIHKYFSGDFFCALKEYVENGNFKRDTGYYDQNQKLVLKGVGYAKPSVLKVDGTTVTFHVRFTVDYEDPEAAQYFVSSVCSWNIPLKEKGLTIGKFNLDCRLPSREWIYGDDIVPIVKKEDYAKMAELFKKKVFENDEPTSGGYTYAKKAAQALGLNTISCDLPQNCVGKIIMSDCHLRLHKQDRFDVTDETVKAGTILFDETKSALMSFSLFGTTILHECFHWVFHRCAFELGKLYRDGDVGFCCMRENVAKGSTAVEGNKFIEIQTNAVVPYILLKKEELNSEVKSYIEDYKNDGLTKPILLERVLDDMRNEHRMSVESMRRCLVEAGMTAFRGISLYQDESYLHSYCFTPGSLAKNETYRLPKDDMEELYAVNDKIRDSVLYGTMIYLDGHLVLNSPKYVSFDEKHVPSLTPYALSNADECFLKFKIQRQRVSEPVLLSYGLNRIPKEMKEVFKAMENESLPLDKQAEATKKWRQHIIAWRSCTRPTFGETLQEILIFRNVKATAFEKQGLSSKQVYRLINNETENPQLASLVTIAATLEMPQQIFIWFIESAGVKYYTHEKEIDHYLMLMSDHSRFKDISEYDYEMYKNGYPCLAKQPRG